MKGSGAWGEYSFDNDHAHDLFSYFETYDAEKDIIIHHREPKKVSKALKKLDDYHFKRIKSNDKSVTRKNYDFSQYNLDSSYLGTILLALLNEYKIPKPNLIKALIQAYKSYFNILCIGPASTWVDSQLRLQSLADEILVLNYAINHGTPFKILPAYQSTFQGEKDDYINMNKFVKWLRKPAQQKKYNLFDKIFLQRKKISPRYHFQKFLVEPPIDPRLLTIGTVMNGFEGRGGNEYFIVDDKQKWTPYDFFNSPANLYIPNNAFEFIYGDNFNKFYKPIGLKKGSKYFNQRLPLCNILK